MGRRGGSGGRHFRQREHVLRFSPEAHHTETTIVNLPLVMFMLFFNQTSSFRCRNLGNFFDNRYVCGSFCDVHIFCRL